MSVDAAREWRLRYRKPSEIRDDAVNGGRDLIDGLLSPSANLLYGPPESGKSTFARQACLSLLDGSSLLGCATDGRKHRVLYVTGDPGGADEAAEQWHNMGGGDEGMTIVDYAPINVTHLSELPDRCRQERITLCLLDNLFRALAPGADVSDNGAVGKVLDILGAVAYAGCSVLLIHHAPKGGGRTPGGSQSIGAWARRRLCVTKTNGGRRLTVGGNNVAERTLAFELVFGGGAPQIRLAEGRQATAEGTPSVQSQSQSQSQGRAAAKVKPEDPVVAAARSVAGGEVLSHAELARRLSREGVRGSHAALARTIGRRRAAGELTWTETRNGEAA